MGSYSARNAASPEAPQPHTVDRTRSRLRGEENQVDGFFGILGKQSFGSTDFRYKNALRYHLQAFMRGRNKSPSPFMWTKPEHAIIKSDRQMPDRISTPVH